MCGRYQFTADLDIREIIQIVEEVNKRHNGAEMKTGEIYPTNAAPIIKLEDDGLHADLAVWGYPNFARRSGVIINARSETAAEKKLFKESLRVRRCIVPSTGFYEWSQDDAHQKYLFRRPETKMLYMAGIYNEYQGEQRFVILTAEGNASIRDIHNRMPVVLRPDQLEAWTSTPDKALDILNGPLPSLEKQAV